MVDAILHGLDREEKHSQSPVRSSLAWAALACTLVLLWQFLTVRYNRGGNWTALFLTGQRYSVPPALAPGTYRFLGDGYDGQMYRYVAHDPLLLGDFYHYIDAPQARYHRILVPALAYLLAAGRQSWIDGSYVALIGGLVALGAYWLGCWATLRGLRPAWGLAFLMVPATLISMDRMTVDVALAAMTVGFAYYWTAQSWPRVFVVLLAACLARETGLLLVGGCCIFELLSKRLGRSLLWASAALPTLAWYAFLSRKFVARHYGVPQYRPGGLGKGLWSVLLHPPRYPLPGAQEVFARSMDVVALAALLCTIVMAVVFLRRRPSGAVAISAALFVALAVALMGQPDYWRDCNEYARVFSPLLILVALQTGTGGIGAAMMSTRWLSLVPVIVVDLRLGIQFSSSIAGVARGLLRP